jgi:PAS domain S-box-containing protein
MIAASRDDRALRKSEDLNTAILEGALTGIFTVSLDGKILDLNPFALKMLGGEFEQVIHQNAVHLFIDDSEQQRVQDALVTVREHLESPLLGLPITITAKRLDGSTFPAELVVTLHKNREFLTGVIRDLSEQRASEQALRRAQKMEAIGQLTGGIAHDFTNILGIIIGNLEFLMRRNSSTANTQDHLQSAYKAAVRATELTRQLMNFTRKVPTAAKPVDLNMLIAGMDRLLGRSVTQQISLHYDLADDLWLTNIDPGEFEDALLNLVINAKDAIDSGGNLTIATANRVVDAIQYKQKNPSMKPGDYVELSVSDTGKGIAENDIDRIFEPFFTTKGREKGTGLGLAMVFAFVERSGGHITVASTIGSGTVFSMLLPRHIEPPESREDSLNPASEIPTGTQTILVVDDEPDLVRLAKMNLASLGYSVVTAGNADEALKAMEDNKNIDLLFTDTVMPGSMNGRELADKAMRMRPELKVLITTGYASGQDDVGETEIGKLPVLRKPYTRAELASCIREALDS